jgi:dTDP-4-dehydrorhamnose 3,5-epimerase
MIFTKTPLAGNVVVIEIERYVDTRGFFARTVCEDQFQAQGLKSSFIQQSISFNPQRGTLRGMHWQSEPYGEVKLVRVTKGSIYDVVVDINPRSSTFKSFYAVELSEHNRKQIYIPEGFAHGFQTLEPDTEVHYEMTTRYKSEASLGFAWDDPSIGISWPIRDKMIIGQRDSEYVNLNELDLE